MAPPDASLWRPLDDALDRAARREAPVRIWLRDDDAVAPTPALDRLIRLCEIHRMPLLLAVIPASATSALAQHVAGHPLITPTQHGYSHRNHAAPGERARELGGLQPLPAVLDDLARGRDRMTDLFGTGTARILVPPWNRIDDAVVPELPSLGFAALSTFGPPKAEVPGLALLNADLDVIDWRNGRVCRPADKLVAKLVTLIDQASDEPHPIGVLTHHLVHDEPAWWFLDACLSRLAAHPAVRFAAAEELLPVRSGRA